MEVLMKFLFALLLSFAPASIAAIGYNQGNWLFMSIFAFVAIVPFFLVFFQPCDSQRDCCHN